MHVIGGPGSDGCTGCLSPGLFLLPLPQEPKELFAVGGSGFAVDMGHVGPGGIL